MSVINKMLQDLETRESQAAGFNADYQPPEKKKTNIKVMLLLIIAVAAIVYGLLTNPSDIVAEVGAPISQFSKQKSVLSKPMQIVESQTETVPTVQPVLVPDSGIIQQPIEQVEVLNTTPEVATQTSVKNSKQSMQLSHLADKEPIEIVTAERPAKFTMSGSGEDKQLSELKLNISENLAAGNLNQAIILLSQLLQSEVDNINARKKLASLKFSQGNYVQAKLLLITGIELFPERVDLRLMLAKVFTAQNQATQAMEVLSEVQPMTDAEEFYAYRAGLARQLKQFDLAKSDYLHLTNIAPLNGKWWLGLAIIEEKIGNRMAALPAYQKAKQSNQLENAVNDFVEQRIQILLGAK